MTHAQGRLCSSKLNESILKNPQPTLDKAQVRYTADFDRSVWFSPQVPMRDYAHLDIPPSEKQEVEEIIKKLLHKSAGPFKVLWSLGNTVTIAKWAFRTQSKLTESLWSHAYLDLAHWIRELPSDSIICPPTPANY